MWRLSVPTADDATDDLVRALTYANGAPVFAISEDQKSDILALYARYNIMQGQPSPQLTGEGLAADLLNAVHDAYGEVYEGRRLGKLRDRLKLSAIRCPYCGFGEIKDLDHHLPRSKYRGLAIYALNLVPCCHPCNNKKRAIAGENPDTQFHHTYLDAIPAERFLLATIQLSAAGMMVEFFIINSAGMNNDTFERLTFQFARLDLNGRFQAEVSMFITSQRTGIELVGAIGAPALKQYLFSAYENSRDDFGLNHWQTALWDALHKNDRFCGGDYIYAFGRKDLGG